MDITIIAFALFAVGALIRTVYGFLSKLATEDNITFDRKYWATLAISIITTFMLAAAAFLVFPIPADVPIIYIVLSALAGGYALNDGVNRGVTTYQTIKKTP
jgi:hypothetical protein